jgi:hypothetical protein
MRRLTALFVTCIAAVASCVGATSAVKPPGKPKIPHRIHVWLCLGETTCGPAAINESYPANVKEAGWVEATGINVKCPGQCFGVAFGTVKVTLTPHPAKSKGGGPHEFVGWRGPACIEAGKRPCTFELTDKQTVVWAIFSNSYES